jgi:outer membrane protein TolC
MVEARYREGLSSVLPTLVWGMTQTYQDTNTGVTTSSDNVQGTLVRGSRRESSFQLAQPIFHGFRELNAIKGVKIGREIAEKNREQALLTLLGDVSVVFYTSIDLQQELQVYDIVKKTTEDRLKELNRRVRLGKSRESEALSTQVELASLEAQIEQTRQNLLTARLTLEFLTGVHPQTPLLDDRADPMIPPLEDALKKVITRPDVIALYKRREQADLLLRYARGGYYPSVDFLGNWYTERPGFQKEIDWDAQFKIMVPIFQGGLVKAQVDIARAQLTTSDLEFSRQDRRARQQVTDAHQQLTQSIQRARLYDKAATLAYKNYDVQLNEYKLGLINNLDVINVLRTTQDLQIEKIRALAVSKNNAIQLRIATGEGL